MGEMLLLDEADKIFSANFIEDADAVLNLLPKIRPRQTMMMSATFPYKTLQERADILLRDPVRIVGGVPVLEDSKPQKVRAKKFPTAPNIDQSVIRVEEPRRTELLMHLMETNRWDRAL